MSDDTPTDEDHPEKAYGDSATAVSPDTQRADPTLDSDAARGSSTVFGEPAEAGTAASAADSNEVADGTDTDEHDQDAEPTTPDGGEQARVRSEGSPAEASYGEDQDAAPSQPPYEQE